MQGQQSRRRVAVAGIVVIVSLVFGGTALAGKGGNGKPPKKTTTTTAPTTTTTVPPTTTTTTTTTTSTTTTSSTTTTTTTVPSGDSWIVTVGDSAISGEAGRWAGNTNNGAWRHDTGADAYFDNAANNAETTSGCHRSKAAEAHIGDVLSLNLACSGARTYTQTSGDFKPGLDWYDGAAGKSQVVQLQEFATSNDVDAVTVLIGANDFGFADIVQQCVTNWLTSPSWWKNYCSDDSSIVSRFTSSAVAARTADVAGAISNVAQAMTYAGYSAVDYTIIIQTYWSPIPRGNDIRYSENGWDRQNVGGCGVWNRDADWANDVAVTSMNQALTNGVVLSGVQNYVVLDMAQSLNGHRLCERNVGLLEEVGLSDWTQPGAADNTEWVNQIRTLSTLFGPYEVQESIHSSYWGQLAMRNCLRQAYGGGAVQGGTCTSTGGVNGVGEPNMTLS